jgi:prepilin-type N-terminal cleavage/methylation domain-containing protein
MVQVISTTQESTRRDPRSGFSLVELIITMLVLSLISGAVFSAFLFFNKSGINIGNYVAMDQQARRALERFAVDARMADLNTSISLSTSEVTLLSIPIDSAGNSYDVTYKFISSSDPTPALRRTFARKIVASDNTTEVPIDAEFVPLISNVVDGSSRFRYYRVGSPIAATASDPTIPQAANPLETKQINIDLVIERVDRSQIVARASNVVLSARYVLRNKVVAN